MRYDLNHENIYVSPSRWARTVFKKYKQPICDNLIHFYCFIWDTLFLSKCLHRQNDSLERILVRCVVVFQEFWNSRHIHRTRNVIVVLSKLIHVRGFTLFNNELRNRSPKNTLELLAEQCWWPRDRYRLVQVCSLLWLFVIHEERPELQKKSHQTRH